MAVYLGSDIQGGYFFLFDGQNVICESCIRQIYNSACIVSSILINCEYVKFSTQTSILRGFV
mgnify:CR=1 FL=1